MVVSFYLSQEILGCCMCMFFILLNLWQKFPVRFWKILPTFPGKIPPWMVLLKKKTVLLISELNWAHEFLPSSSGGRFVYTYMISLLWVIVSVWLSIKSKIIYSWLNLFILYTGQLLQKCRFIGLQVFIIVILTLSG